MPTDVMTRTESRGTGKYEQLLARCKGMTAAPTAVAHPCDDASLGAVVEAARAGIIAPILVGPVERIRTVAKTCGLDIEQYEIADVPHSHAAAARAVELVRLGRADLLMKGSLHTDELMSEVVKRETGLRTDRRVSHAFVMDVPTYHKPLLITDAAVNIFPTLDDKRDIVQNAIDFVRVLGAERPKVAILSAVETVTTKIPSTIDAAALCKMADRGQIQGAILDGPLAFDNAISAEAARTKGISSAVAGDPDIVLVPDLEAGNMLAKNLTFLSRADAAGVVLGARVPIILTSRADNQRTRLASCGVAALYAAARRRARLRLAVPRGRPRAGGSPAIRDARAAAPALQPRPHPHHPDALPGHAPGGLLRHRVSPRACGRSRPLRAARRALSGGRAPLRLPRTVLRVHRTELAAGRAGDRAGGGGGRAPRQRRQHA